MATAAAITATTLNAFRANHARRSIPWVPITLITIALLFLSVFLFVLLAAVFYEALRKGASVYWEAISEPDAISAIRLTFIAALIAVPLNLVFGVAAAWAITKFDFRFARLVRAVAF